MSKEEKEYYVVTKIDGVEKKHKIPFDTYEELKKLNGEFPMKAYIGDEDVIEEVEDEEGNIVKEKIIRPVYKTIVIPFELLKPE